MLLSIVVVVNKNGLQHLYSQYRENVLINSEYFGPELEHGHSVTRATGYFIDVADYGMGINPAHARRIFSEGFRAAEMGRLEIRGSGIGLSVVRNILLSLGGTVWLSKNVDPTTFTLFFPVHLLNPTPAEQAAFSAFR